MVTKKATGGGDFADECTFLPINGRKCHWNIAY